MERTYLGLLWLGAGIGGKVGGDFEAEAGEFALLQVIVDEEADADGEGNEAAGGYGEEFAFADDESQQDAKQDDADADRGENDPSPARIAEAAQGVPGARESSASSADSGCRT